MMKRNTDDIDNDEEEVKGKWGDTVEWWGEEGVDEEEEWKLMSLWIDADKRLMMPCWCFHEFQDPDDCYCQIQASIFASIYHRFPSQKYDALKITIELATQARWIMIFIISNMMKFFIWMLSINMWIDIFCMY